MMATPRIRIQCGHIKVDIQCGEKTCASEPGEFCQYVGTRCMGTKFICRLFPTSPSGESHTALKEEDGWLMRCGDCLKKEAFLRQTGGGES